MIPLTILLLIFLYKDRDRKQLWLVNWHIRRSFVLVLYCNFFVMFLVLNFCIVLFSPFAFVIFSTLLLVHTHIRCTHWLRTLHISIMRDRVQRRKHWVCKKLTKNKEGIIIWIWYILCLNIDDDDYNFIKFLSLYIHSRENVKCWKVYSDCTQPSLTSTINVYLFFVWCLYLYVQNYTHL